MKFEWDTEKEKNNRNKHKVGFQDACYVFTDELMLTLYDPDHSEEEDRWITIGQAIDNKLVVVSHTYRKAGSKEFVRLISARKATRREAKMYFERRAG